MRRRGRNSARGPPTGIKTVSQVPNPYPDVPKLRHLALDGQQGFEGLLPVPERLIGRREIVEDPPPLFGACLCRCNALEQLLDRPFWLTLDQIAEAEEARASHLIRGIVGRQS